MADMNFLFTAQEQISEALDSAAQATNSLDRDLGGLATSMANASFNSVGAEEEFEKFSDNLKEVSATTSNFEERLDDARRSLIAAGLGSETTEKQLDDLRMSMYHLQSSTEPVDQSMDELNRTFFELRNTGSLTGEQIGDLQTKLTNLSATTQTSTNRVSAFNRAMLGLYGAAQSADEAVEDANRSFAVLDVATMSTVPSLNALRASLDRVDEGLEDVSIGANKASGSMSVLAALSQTAAFEFGSLSVNIGPFNLALRNFITQVPAILTGMGSMLAIVSSLIVAFATLATVTGLLVVGGALAFWEKFSAQFEEAGEAAEALGSALKELFTEALAPLMTEPNLDLFIGAIQGAANVVNRFAQFAAQMREEVLGSLGGVSGDIDDLFNAMRNSFILLEPVVIGFINFMSQDLPVIMEIFAQLTSQVDSDIGLLINSIGSLMSELLNLASVILTGITPTLLILLEALTVAFSIINALPSGLTAMFIGFTVAALGALKLTSSLVGLTVWLGNANVSMMQQVGTGSLLGVVYESLVAAAVTYINTEKSLWTVTKLATAAIWQKITALVASRVNMIRNAVATRFLMAAKSNLIASITGTIAALSAESVITAIASAAMTAYGVATTVASTATWSLIGAVSTLLSPLLAIVAVFGLLIAAFLQLIGIDVLGGVADMFKAIIGWIQKTIDKVLELIGLGGDGGGPGADMPGIADPDAIQTNPNVNLNFDEKTENNMDIKADPEEKGQLSRVVKDAMEEANSMERQKNGFTGN